MIATLILRGHVGMSAFAISIFFISWAMIFGICIDYRSAASIGIRIVLVVLLGLGKKLEI